jgi:hypothetical protein
MIGPGWQAAATPQGTPRLFEADDHVRLELSRALHRNVPLIPVLVGGAGLPAATELPDDLQGLVHRQGVILHDETWHQDVEGLLRSLRGQPAAPPGRRRRWLVPAGVGAALVVLAGLGAAAGWWGPGRDGGSGDGGRGGSRHLDPGLRAAPGPGLEPHRARRRPDRPGEDRERLPGLQGEGGLSARGRGEMAGAPGHQHGERHPGTCLSRGLAVQLAGRRPEENKATCFAPTPNLVESQTVGDALIGFEVSCEPSGYIQLILENDSARISVTDDTQEPAAC